MAFTHEHKHNLSLAHIGLKNPNYPKNRKSNKLTDETKTKISIANKGKVRSKELRERWSQSHLGKVRTEEEKVKQSESLKIAHTKKMWGFALKNIPWNKDLKGIGDGKPRHAYNKEFREKISKTNRGEAWRQKLRIAACKKIDKLGGMLIGNYEPPILNYLEKQFNYMIIRQYRIIGYSLDGYCPALNLAIEIDEKSNHSRENQKQKDLIRQKRIEKELNCSFLRINII